MGWIDKVRVVYNTVVDTTVDVTASLLSTGGALACGAAGVGFALAQGMEKTFCTSYYGSGVGMGGLNITGTLDNTAFGINYVLPIHVGGKKDGEDIYNLNDYADSGTIAIISAVLVSSGFVLKALGDNLKTWQQYRYDERYSSNTYGKIIVKPTREGYCYNTAASVCTSLTIAMLSHSIASCVVYYAPLLNSHLYLTYPFKGAGLAHKNLTQSRYYDGPIATQSYPVAFALDPQEVPFNLPFFGNTTILLKMVLNGLANVTYGGGLFFKENNPTDVSPSVPQASSAIIAMSAYLAANFFARKTRYLNRKNEESMYFNVDEQTPIEPTSDITLM